MVRALGFSNAPFHPFRPGRLCRGRERWIEAWEPDEGESDVAVHRLVVSGATFSDLSASDALRGLPHAGVDPASLIRKLFPRTPLLAFMEDGHPADIPESAEGVELYEGHRAGGRAQIGLVRWYLRVNTVAEVRGLLGGPEEDKLRGFAVLESGTDDAELFESLFRLVGMATLDSPPARFQPAALPELVQRVKALVLVHRDKHGLSLGIYSSQPIALGDKLEKMCASADCLLVPFAIPPMLARWDRALSELRDAWEGDEPFPVPEPEGGYSWQARGRRRRRKGRDRDGARAAEPTTSEPSEPVVAPPPEDASPELPASTPDDAVPPGAGSGEE